MNSTGQILLGLLLTVLPLSVGFAKEELPDMLSSLLNNSPFGTPPQGKPVSAPPSQLELRGVVVEGDVVWFSFYDGATKEWTTLREGEQMDALYVKEFNRVQDVVVLEYKGKPLTLALKSTGNQFYRRDAVASVSAATTDRAIVSVASVAPGTGFAAMVHTAGALLSPPVMVPPLSEAEAKRLELVASSIRQMLEASKSKAAAAGANST